jgi:hypothetical protein
MTETALRARAYRRQVPFHLNGRRIRFTASDLREIAEGHPRRPQEPAAATAKEQGVKPSTARRSPARNGERQTGERPQETWRARKPGDKPPRGDGRPR